MFRRRIVCLNHINMNDTCVRDSSRREKQLSETTDHTCCRCFNHHKTDEQHRTKRLKTLRERRQMRGERKENSKSKFHHHHCCHHQASKDAAHFHNCCHSGYNSRRDLLFPKVVPAAQEPSIITDHRLIGHHGLFNHEVKSFDIERLLSEQSKLDKEKEKAQDEKNTLSCPSPASCSNDLVGDAAAEVLPFEEKEAPLTDTRADCQEKEETICHESDLTPGQGSQQQHYLSPESSKSIFSSKHSFLNVVVSMSKKKVDSVMHEEDKESHSTLDNVETHLAKKNKDPAAQQTHTRGACPSSPLLSSCDTQHRKDPVCVSFITALAPHLCDSLQFPRLRRRDLLTESRELLLMVLRARHGPRFQENLLRDLSFGADSPKAPQDHCLETAMKDEEILSAAYHVDNVDQPYFDTQKTTKSNLKPPQSLKWTADWLTSPMDNSIGFLDDILRPKSSPLFCMDFEPSGASAHQHLSTPSPTSCRAEKASVFERWDKSLFRPKCKELPGFDSFENAFKTHSRTVSTRPSLSYQARLLHFPPEPDPFRTDRHSFPPPFSTQIPNPNPSSHLQSHTSTGPLLGSYHSDIIHYPPSHLLDRSSAPSPFSLPSPEHWSFPPMKLY